MKVPGNVAKDVSKVEQEKVSQELESESRFQSERGMRVARCSFGRISLLDTEESVVMLDTPSASPAFVLVWMLGRLKTLPVKISVVGNAYSGMNGGAHIWHGNSEF